MDDLIRMEKPLLLVLEVLADAIGTNGAPPRARVLVIDVLHGPHPRGECDTLFPPDKQSRFYALRGGGDAGLAEWEAIPCASPETGSRVIVAANLLVDGALEAWPHSVRPDDAAERTRMRALFEDDS